MPGEHGCVVYILSSRSRALYVGVTGNLPARIHAHRTGALPGRTRRYMPCHPERSEGPAFLVNAHAR